MPSERGTISRRSLLAGAGGAALLGTAARANAAPLSSRRAAATSHPDGVPPGLASISSAPERGVSYRFAMWEQMTPLNNLTDGRVFESDGVTSTSADSLGAAFEIPPGASVHDVEAYYNATQQTSLNVAVWSSGIANLANVIASTPLGPYTGQTMHATKLAVPAAVAGPFPHGTMLVVSIDTLPNESVQINGFRVGFTSAPLATVLLATPVRVYDSRKTTPFSAGQTRTISLASYLPAAANGAQYVVSALNANGTGALYAGAGGTSPAIPAVRWSGTGDRGSDSVTSAVDAEGRIAVHSISGSGNVDVTIDLVGYLV